MNCIICKRIATQRHHCFSQTKINIKIYGRKLIDADFNIVPVCIHCHSGHAHIPRSLIWNEQKFREEAIKAGHNLPEGNKSYKK